MQTQELSPKFLVHPNTGLKLLNRKEQHSYFTSRHENTGIETWAKYKFWHIQRQQLFCIISYMGISTVKLTIMDLSMNKNKNQYFLPKTKI